MIAWVGDGHVSHVISKTKSAKKWVACFFLEIVRLFYKLEVDRTVLLW